MHRQADTPDQMPLMLSHPVRMVVFRPAFLANALAITLLLAGAIFFARRRRSYRCDHWRPAVDQRRRRQMRPDFTETAARGSAAGLRRNRSVGQPPMPTDPAHDLKTSLRELMSDLQRARAASGPLLSFAPPARWVKGPGASAARQGRTRSVSAPLTSQPVSSV
jgi:hypothetical protein